MKWKQVRGWEGLYEVSDDGHVRSLDRLVERSNGTSQKFSGKELKSFKNSAGYLVVRLSDASNGRRECARVHRLVATSFIENPDMKPEVNHIDGDKSNPRLSNLEWVTPHENRDHAWKTGLRNSSHLRPQNGEKNGSSKLTDECVIAMRKRREQGETYQCIADSYGVDKRTAMRAIKGEQWAHIPAAPKPESEL